LFPLHLAGTIFSSSILLYEASGVNEILDPIVLAEGEVM